MLSLDDCRKILGPDAPADEHELEAWREGAYQLARLVFEICQSQKSSIKTPKTSKDPQT